MRKNIRIFIGIAAILCLTLLPVSCGVSNLPIDPSGETAASTNGAETDTSTERNTDQDDTDHTDVTDQTDLVTTEKESTKEDLFDLPTPSGDYLLTYENLGVLGSENNIVYFVIDRFDWEYYVWAREKAPEIFHNLDSGGFTYYDDAISLYPRTFPSIAYMVTGAENDFSQTCEDYFASAYGRSEFMRQLYREGYTVNIYTDEEYGYINAAYMANYTANAKPAGNDQATYSTDMRDIYNHLTQNGISIGESKKSYAFIHLSGTHLPLLYDENFDSLPEDDAERWDSTLGMKQSFAIINYYIDEMKRLGVYDNATIIITGDHPSIGSDSDVPLRWAHVTPLFVKPSSNADGALQVSSAPVTHADIFPTILQSEGIASGMDFGRSLFEITEDENRERLYYFQKYDKIDGRTNYEMVVFAINGKAADYKNWEIRERYYLGKSIYG